MQATLMSKTQPVIGYCYDGISVDGSTRTDSKVIYRGFSEGRHTVQDIYQKTYRAERVSSHEEEPIFQFKVTDIVL